MPELPLTQTILLLTALKPRREVLVPLVSILTDCPSENMAMNNEKNRRVVLIT
jgi:hypothetical protein